jgi:hypothetical protein
MSINDIKVIDKASTTLFVNVGAYRMHHPLRDHYFEPGVKYLIDSDDWMAGQPTLVETDMAEDVTPKVQKPKQPNSPKIEKD